MGRSYLFLAEGFEELEALAVIDVLRRGDVEVFTVAVARDHEVTGAHGVIVSADLLLADVPEVAECLIFPGGMPGAQNLGNCKELMEMLQKHYDKGGYVAAICAAPALVLSKLKTKKRLKLTTYPGFEKYLPEAEIVGEGVVVDGRVITGKGPGFAVKFGLTVLEQLRSADKAKEVAAGMLL